MHDFGQSVPIKTILKELDLLPVQLRVTCCLNVKDHFTSGSQEDMSRSWQPKSGLNVMIMLAQAKRAGRGWVGGHVALLGSLLELEVPQWLRRRGRASRWRAYRHRHRREAPAGCGSGPSDSAQRLHADQPRPAVSFTQPLWGPLSRCATDPSCGAGRVSLGMRAAPLWRRCCST